MSSEQPKFEIPMGERTENFSEEKRSERQPEIKEGIASIEGLPVDYQDKMGLALLFLGERPVVSAEVSRRIYKGEESGDLLNQLATKKDQVVAVLEKLGLTYRVAELRQEEEKTRNLGHHFFISKNSENLSRLLKAIKRQDDKEVGLALGYPESACEAYVEKTLLDYKELPGDVREQLIKDGTSKFLPFRLSRDHWQEELDLVKKWQGLLKKNSPYVYEEIIKEGVDQIKEDDLRRQQILDIRRRLEEGEELSTEEFHHLWQEKEIVEREEKEEQEKEAELRSSLEKWTEKTDEMLRERIGHFGLEESVIEEIRKDLRSCFEEELVMVTDTKRIKELREDSLKSIENLNLEITAEEKSLLERISKKDILDLLNRKLGGDIITAEERMLDLFSYTTRGFKLGVHDSTSGRIGVYLLNPSNLEDYQSILMHEFTHKGLANLKPEAVYKAEEKIMTAGVLRKEFVGQGTAERTKTEHVQGAFFISLMGINEALAHRAGKYYGRKDEPFYEAYKDKINPKTFKTIYLKIETVAAEMSRAEFDDFAAHIYSFFANKWKEDLSEEEFGEVVSATIKEIDKFKKK